jgi:hypothetical protein
MPRLRKSRAVPLFLLCAFLACNGETSNFLLVFDNDMNSVLLIVTDIVPDLAELFALLFTVEEDDSS